MIGIGFAGDLFFGRWTRRGLIGIGGTPGRTIDGIPAGTHAQTRCGRSRATKKGGMAGSHEIAAANAAAASANARLYQTARHQVAGKISRMLACRKSRKGVV